MADATSRHRSLSLLLVVVAVVVVVATMIPPAQVWDIADQATALAHSTLGKGDV
jgi:hypothetical protein